MTDYELARRNIDESQLVCAAAGTGKTRVLVERYLNIVLNGRVDIDRVIAITFTEKAAAEMKTRIRQELLRNDQEDLCDRINTAPIATVHSFCARILFDNVRSVALDPQFDIIDEVRENVRRRETLDHFLNNRLSTGDSDLYTLLEYLPLSRLREMLSIIWNRRWEFRPLIPRYCNMTNQEYQQQIAEWHKADIKMALEALFDDPQLAEAYHRMQSFDLSDRSDNLKNAFRIILEAKREYESGMLPAALEKGTLSEGFNGRNRGRKENWGADLELARGLHRDLRERWREIRDRFNPPDPALEERHLRALQSLLRLAGEFIETYQGDLLESGQIDFHGLELQALDFLEKKPQAAKKYLEKYRHLLVDEFQDINPVQHRIIEEIQGRNSGIVPFFVGDEKQSIYRFRGAEVEIFNRLKKARRPLQLDRNFRSTPALMRFFNAFFSETLGQAVPRETYKVHYPVAIHPHFTQDADSCPVELLLVTEEDTSTLPATFSNVMAEASLVVERMRELHDKGIIQIRDEKIRPARWGDMVILLRSRTHQPVFEAGMRKAGIPYFVTSGIGFYERREVIDIVNMLRALMNLRDEVALVGVLRSPLFGVTDNALQHLNAGGNLFRGISRFMYEDKLPRGLTGEDSDALLRFRTVYGQLKGEVDRFAPAELIQKILDNTHYLAVLAGLENADQCLANVKKLIDLALEWGAGSTLSVVDFIRQIEIYRTIEVRENEANLASEYEDSVLITTIHGAKGLSFPIVFVPQLAAQIRYTRDQLLCNSKYGAALKIREPYRDTHPFLYQYLAREERKRIFAEEQRLLYVAATRAQSYLVMSAGNPRESQRADKSIWSWIAPFFENDEYRSLYRKREKSPRELFEIYQRLDFQPERAARPLSKATLKKISRQIQPLSDSTRIKRLTATQFAEWECRQQYADYLPVFTTGTPEADQPLTPLELGNLIHQAFQWWDFKSLASFRKIVAQLLIPHRLPDNEREKLMVRTQSWAERLRQAGKGLVTLIDSASEIEREVEIFADFEGVVIEGKIDLLLKDDRQAYRLIDFKSDDIRGEPEKWRLLKYNAQLDLYALVLARWSGLPVREKMIYFIRTGRLQAEPVNTALLDKAERRIRAFIAAGS